MFTQKDLHQIAKKGIRIDEINRQINHFQKGFPPTYLHMSATPGKGIIVLSEGDEQRFREIFLNNGPDFNITRFIPASGAATRMFKSLYEAFDKLEGRSKEEQSAWVDNNPEIREFFEKLKHYPFFEDLKISGDALSSEILKSLLEGGGPWLCKQTKGIAEIP